MAAGAADSALLISAASSSARTCCGMSNNGSDSRLNDLNRVRMAFPPRNLRLSGAGQRTEAGTNTCACKRASPQQITARLARSNVDILPQSPGVVTAPDMTTKLRALAHRRCHLPRPDLATDPISLNTLQPR